MQLLRTVFESALGFVYPPHCRFCGVATGEHRVVLCCDCRDALTPEPTRSCTICGAPVGPYLNTEAGCVHCRRDRFAFEKVLRLGVYEGAMRSACQRIKQEFGEGLAAACAELLCSQQGDAMRAVDADWILPVPAHWSSRFQCSDNAAETIARRLAAWLHVPFSRHILRKIRKTRRQSSLKPNERRTNLRNAFRASAPRRLRGRTVLLVDDVLTTGSTAHEASRALKKAGVARVVVAVLARGLGR